MLVGAACVAAVSWSSSGSAEASWWTSPLESGCGWGRRLRRRCRQRLGSVEIARRRRRDRPLHPGLEFVGSLQPPHRPTCPGPASPPGRSRGAGNAPSCLRRPAHSWPRGRERRLDIRLEGAAAEALMRTAAATQITMSTRNRPTAPTSQRRPDGSFIPTLLDCAQPAPQRATTVVRAGGDGCLLSPAYVNLRRRTTGPSFLSGRLVRFPGKRPVGQGWLSAAGER